MEDREAELTVLNRASEVFGKILVIAVFVAIVISSSVTYYLMNKQMQTLKEHYDHCINRCGESNYKVPDSIEKGVEK